MFRMRFQVPNKPVYQPPTPNIRIQPASTLVRLPLGGIFSPLAPSGPCSSCGGK
jgi:hypothetical protein